MQRSILSADGRSFGSQCMVGRLRRVLVRRPDTTFGQADPGRWHYTAQPDLDGARAEHDAFCDVLREAGADIWLGAIGCGAFVSPDEKQFSGPFGGSSGGAYSYMAGNCSRYLPDEEEQQCNEDQLEECEYQSRHCVTLPGT